MLIKYLDMSGLQNAMISLVIFISKPQQTEQEELNQL